MHPVLRWVVTVLGVLAGLVLLLMLFIFTASNNRLNRVYEFPLAEIVMLDDSTAIENGRHLAITRGCVDCHAYDFGGYLVADDPALGYVAGPNLTTGKGGLPITFSDEDFIRAIRHGVGTDGRGLVVMPSEEYYYLGDEDLASLIAYIRSLPPVDREFPKSKLRFVGRALLALNKAPFISAEHIAHRQPHPGAPPKGPTKAYGAYVAYGCTGCHGQEFSGGPIPIGPPDWPPATNLTPDQATGLGTWTEADFFHAMRDGIRPDGSEINPIMPWKQFGQMTDDELTALWLYLSDLPAKAEGGR